MASMDGSPHLLSLKVMRVSRPALASSWEPFYSSSPSFSARSTASVMSLQTKEPLPGHPKTLRDFNLTEILMLPAAFGAIQLGETFSSCIAVNNETDSPVEGVTLRIEIQTATTKLILAEFGGPTHTLASGDTMENIVHHEIKELGQHVLACSVFYRLPPGARPNPSSSEAHDPSIQSFRKFYKFQVTNPLSVKTKVHLPRSPSALHSVSEREKVFLEVHIQNLTQDAMYLQRMHFECTDGWHAVDANIGDITGKDQGESLFSGVMALMQPQDMRQYIYILTPSTIPTFPVAHTPGAVIPLGRLDISWRSSFGEPGRLLTSMLSRRIPLVQPLVPPPPPPPKQTVSALPLHLQRSASVASAPSRMQSPHLSQRPMSPPAAPGSPVPYRPASPFRNRQSTMGPLPPRVGSPAPASPQPTTPTPQKAVVDIEVDLVVKSIPRNALAAEKPFKVGFALNVSALVPWVPNGQARRKRGLTFAIQHVQPPRLRAATTKIAAQPRTEPWSPRLPSSGFSTPSPYATPHRADFQDVLARKLLVASPRQTLSEAGSDSGRDVDGRESALQTPLPAGMRKASEVITLPSPFAAPDSNSESKQYSHDVVFQGPSALFLPAMQFSVTDGQVLEHHPVADGDRVAKHDRNWSESTITTTDSEADSESDVPLGQFQRSVRAITTQDFELEYLPLKSGFLTIGGLRVVLVDDKLLDESDDSVIETGKPKGPESVRSIKEYDVIGEVWVKASGALGSV